MRPIRDGIARIGYELRSYARTPDLLLFSFAFPIMMFLLFASIFDDERYGTAPDGSGGVSPAEYYLAVMIASSILLAGMQTLSIDIAVERHEGGLARLGRTPMRPLSFFIGKFGCTFITCLLQTALLFTIAHLGFGVSLPADGARWVTLGWTWLLGLACCSALGVALSALPRSARSASAVVIPIVLVLQFASGIYLPITVLPEWMSNAASALPLLWMGHGIRHALLPDVFSAAEPGGQWQLPLTAVVLGAWLLVGLAGSFLTFRWDRARV